MSGPLDDYIKRMIEENAKARERATARLRRLADSIGSDDWEENVDQVLDEYEQQLKGTVEPADDQVHGGDGETQGS